MNDELLFERTHIVIEPGQAAPRGLELRAVRIWSRATTPRAFWADGALPDGRRVATSDEASALGAFLWLVRDAYFLATGEPLPS